jgi:hypothetical protein
VSNLPFFIAENEIAENTIAESEIAENTIAENESKRKITEIETIDMMIINIKIAEFFSRIYTINLFLRDYSFHSLLVHTSFSRIGY